MHEKYVKIDHLNVSKFAALAYDMVTNKQSKKISSNPALNLKVGLSSSSNTITGALIIGAGLLCSMTLNIGQAMATPQTLSCPDPAAIYVGNQAGDFASMQDAVNAATAGGTICVRAGTYTANYALVNKDLHIVGVGGYAHFQGDGIFNGNGEVLQNNLLLSDKGIFVTRANVTFENIEFSNAVIEAAQGNNGAGIRQESGNLTVINSYFHDNQNGILATPDSGGVYDAVVRDSVFKRNGAGDGLSHGHYFNHMDDLLLSDNYYEGQKVGHHGKSRANTTTVLNSGFEDGTGGVSTISGYAIDASNGGDLLMQGNAVYQRSGGNPNAINRNHIAYGQEVTSNTSTQRASNTVVVTDNAFYDFTAVDTILDNNGFIENLTTSAEFSDNRRIDTSNVSSSAATVVTNSIGELSVNAVDKLPNPTGILAVRNTDVNDAANRAAGILTFDAASLALNDSYDVEFGVSNFTGVATGSNGVIYVANESLGVGIFDQTLGTGHFFSGGILNAHSLAADENNLYVGLLDSNMVYTCGLFTGSTLFGETCSSTITLNHGSVLGITGLATDGASLYAASYNDGNIYQFDMSGNLLGSINTGLGSDVVSGLEYDVDNDIFWVSTGYGSDEIYRFASDGSLISSGAAALTGLTGLDLDQLEDNDFPNVIPEPGTATLTLISALWAVRARRSA